MNITISDEAVEITQHIEKQKSIGKSAKDAAESLKTGYEDSVPEMAFKANAVSSFVGKIKTAFVAEALKAIYELTPLETARIMKSVFEDDASNIALGLKHGYSNLTATDVGKILLDAQVYPDLTSLQMKEALLFGGFSQADATNAIAQLYSSKKQFTVNPTVSWQDTGVTVDANERVTIVYKSGRWTASPWTGYVDGNGTPSYVAKPGYALPGAREAALIGKVGSNVFLVGNNGSVPNGATGNLFLCINDDLERRYGVGVLDNTGSITVEIEEKNM